MYELPRITCGQDAPGVKKLTPEFVLTSRMQIIEIGRMVTLFVSRTVTFPPGLEPIAVTIFVVFWQWVTA